MYNDSFLSDLVELDRARKRLKAELAEVETARKVLEATILDEWERTGTSSIKVDGITIYLSSQRWVKPKDGDRQAVVKVLEVLGMTEMINFNSQTLSSYVREILDTDQVIPPELETVIEVTEDFKIKTRGT